ncbi:hypothetical protein [Oceanobacillus damuensis]|uniref:hypothetical protein n=1 Tax=Oceanobacillus damuensis TaxID=937928 RepID=UPI000832FDDF|nr:hypothetical protein [Oceanobacillus damuensis]
MNLIAEQPYIKIVREVNSIEQIDIEHQRKMYLYEEKIVTEHREFSIDDVLDISYRFIGMDGGLLYLHTIYGAYSYIVKNSPEAFVEAFKAYRKTMHTGEKDL